MSAPRLGAALPLHPDQYGSLGHRLGPDVEADLFGEGALELSEEQYDALWEEERQIRGLAEKHIHPGCGHECEAGACVLFCGTKDWLCPTCLVAAERRAREWRRRALDVRQESA